MSSTRTPQWNLIRLMLYSALVATVYSFCSEPLNLTFAVHNGTKDNYTEGETVIYSCLEGYITNLSANNVSTCGPNGEWSPILPDLCRRICPQPDNLTNAVPIIDNTTYEEGDNVTYSCLPEYKYIPPKNNVSTCGVNGTWSPFEENFCARICPQPENLTNAVPNIDKPIYEEGDNVIYSCLPEYNYIPPKNNVSSCGVNGTWSPFEENFCARICPQPENLTDAVPVIDKPIYEEGDNVIYSCLPEYKYIPPKNNVSSCGVNGTWSPFEENFCAKLQCDFPDILENGNVEFQDRVLGSIASYTCLEGYILFGDDKRHCLADEKWNGTVPLCNRTCSEPPEINFTKILTSTSSVDGYYPQSTQVNYICIPGFTPNISLPSFTTCQSDFTWTQIAVFCMRISCGSPGTLENGKVIKENDKFESKAEFVCDEGYMLLGNKERKCLENGAWSGSVPTCQRSCPNPPTLNSSEIVDMPDIGYFQVGIFIIYKCLPGYKYDPFLLPAIECLKGFTWSNITEFCKKLICGEPERIKNGNLEKTGTDFGSVATYSCNPGFTMTGNPQRRCTEDAVWEGSPPVCQKSEA